MGKSGIGCLLAGLVVLAAIAIIGGLFLVGGYNRLVSLSQDTNRQWSQVENVYQRRADLVPNLVQTVQGAAKFEKSTLVEVTQARASVGQVRVNPDEAAANPEKFQQYAQAQNQLGNALSRLLVVAERYPELKSNQNFLNLQAQLEGTENRIAVERGRYNEVAQAYNTAVRSFPTVLYAGVMGFRERPYFNAAPGSETAPKVQFDFDSHPTPAPAK